MSDTEQLLKSAVDLGAHRLSIREYSAREMTRYLLRKKFSQSVAEKAVEQLIERHWLNDDRFARAVARSQVGRSKGPGSIRMKLMQKGVSMDMSQAKALFSEASEISELQMAREVVQKKYPRAMEDQKQRQRAFSALIRRGFSSQIAQAALKVSELEL